MSRIAVIAALPGELRPLVRGWPREVRSGVELWRGRRGGDEWIAACAGMGRAAAARAVEEAAGKGTGAEKRVDRIVSLGWVGALGPQFRRGRAFRVTEVVDGRDGTRFGSSAGGEPACVLVTVDRVADREEKRRLATAFGADLVDMEASEIAGWAAGRGLPFACVKGVSDEWNDRLPDFNRFIADGKLRTGALAGHVLPRPWFWPGLIRLGWASGAAARSISRVLLGDR